jgi:peroxiredoxin
MSETGDGQAKSAEENKAPMDTKPAEPVKPAAAPLTQTGALRLIVEEQTKAAEAEWLQAWQTGPIRTRWEKQPVQLGDPAPDLELKDTSGKVVRLSDYWKDKPVLLIYWRHFGCSCGFDRAAKLVKEMADYDKSGGKVVIVGQGEPERTNAYAQKAGLTGTILCDPEHHAYIAYGLLEGTPAQVLFDAPDEMLKREYNAGVEFQKERIEKGRPPVDSPWQLPGEFVIDTQGTIQLAYRYNFCEDWPDPRVHIAALRKAAGTL